MATNFLDRDGGRIAYEVSGDGPLVVLSHGMGNSRHAFRHLTPLLVEAGYRVAAIDVRGHGESSTGWPSYAPAEIGADLIALVRHLGGPATVVGSSSSAAAVVFTAAAAPQDMNGIVQISPFVQETKPNLVMRLAQALVLRSPRLWAMYYKTLFPSGRPADFDEYVRAMTATLSEPGRMAAVPAVVAPAAAHWTERVGDVRCPALIVMGAKDPDFKDPAGEARLAEDLFANGALRMIEESGHYPYADRPAETAAALVEFLGRVAHA